MSTEYSPSTDEEFSEIKDHHNQINDISDNDTENSDGKLEKISRTQDSIDVFNQIPKRTVPNINVPEKIIICIDVCQSIDSSLFVFNDGTTFTPLNLVKRITEFFLYSKQNINNNTEFALILLKESEPVWMNNFTKNIMEIINLLDFEGEDCKIEEFDLGKLFDMINDKVSMAELCIDYKLVPPPNIVRLILLYNRSDCLPKLSPGTSSFDLMKDHPYFTVDVLYIHNEKCAKHKCEEIFDVFQTLDNGYSYLFEVTGNAAKVHECGAKLLAHPLQRPAQKCSSYHFVKET